jgi:hypothetical protein
MPLHIKMRTLPPPAGVERTAACIPAFSGFDLVLWLDPLTGLLAMLCASKASR